MKNIEKKLKTADKDDTRPDYDNDEAGNIYTTFLSKKKKNFALQKSFVKKKKHK